MDRAQRPAALATRTRCANLSALARQGKHILSPPENPAILRNYAMALGLCTALFIGRVAGQLLVALFGTPFLPPMQQWYSGLIPYSLLLPIQIAIIALMLWLVRDFARGHGYFLQPHPRGGRILRGLSIVYFASMLLRYTITCGCIRSGAGSAVPSQSGFTWCSHCFCSSIATIISVFGTREKTCCHAVNS